MSKEAFEVIVHDYETWDAGDAYSDKICLHEVSKLIRGEARVAESGVQDCESPACKTLKRHSEFRMELAPGPCDSEISKETLSGMAEGEIVGAFKDGDMSKRGGHTGRFKWEGAGSMLVGRLRGVSNAGTHYPPASGDCEKCEAPGHAEGWIRAAVVDGHSEGCRVAASYTLRFDLSKEGTTFEGTLEGLLICQCTG